MIDRRLRQGNRTGDGAIVRWHDRIQLAQLRNKSRGLSLMQLARVNAEVHVGGIRCRNGADTVCVAVRYLLPPAVPQL